MDKSMKYTKYTNEKVEIKVSKKIAKAKIKKFDLGKLKDYKPKQSKFKPHRLVINFGVVDEDDPENILKEFDPPIEVKIHYRAKDLKKAQKEEKPLRLAYWNGDDWEYFTEEKHDFRLEADPDEKKGGFGYVKITKWGDPPLGWGV